MKVGIAVRRWSARGGLEANVLGLARYLVAAGHQVEVIAQRLEHDEPGVRVRPVEMSSLWPEPLKIGRFSRRAAVALEEGGYDVSFTSGHVAGPSVVRLEGGLSHDYQAARPEVARDPTERAVARNERHKIERAKRLLPLSEAAAASLRTHYGVAAERIQVVRNGIDLQRFTPRSAHRPGPAPVVAFVGSGFGRKGLGPLIEALATVPGARLLVAGADREQARYQAQAARLGVGLELLGFVEDVRSVLAQADLLAAPSLYDPYGLTVLEALAVGLPVVTTRATGASEISPFPELVVDAPNPPALAEALAQAWALAQRPDTGERARSAAEAWPLAASYAAIAEVLALVAHSSPPSGSPGTR